MRISDWSSDVCSSDLLATVEKALGDLGAMLGALAQGDLTHRIAEGHRGLFAQLADDANPLAEKLADIVGRLHQTAGNVRDARSDVRRVGKECVCPCRSRCAHYVEKKINTHKCK